MSGFGLLLVLTGFAIQFLADLAWCSERGRMALPLPMKSSPIWLIVLGLVCEVVRCLMTSF
jgi:hypothetical protein